MENYLCAQGELGKVLNEVRTQMQYTVLSYPQRDPQGITWGSPKYNGNCSGKVPLGFIDKLGVRSVCEVFAGSGTLSDVCRDYGIPYCGIDLNPAPVRENIVAMDILDMEKELPDAFYEADMCFSHPPYPGINNIKYAGSAWKDTQNLSVKDIQNMPFDEGMKKINMSTMRVYAAMQPGAFMVLLVGEIRAGGKYYSMYQNLALPGEVFQTYVKLQHNVSSGRKNYCGRSQKALTGHEMIVVVKKPSGYEIAYVVPRVVSGDIRDSRSATWKDVVYAVMRNSKGNVTLNEIYSELESHAKSRSNSEWKAKIRQVLQRLRDSGKVVNVGRGAWCLAA